MSATEDLYNLFNEFLKEFSISSYKQLLCIEIENILKKDITIEMKALCLYNLLGEKLFAADVYLPEFVNPTALKTAPSTSVCLCMFRSIYYILKEEVI